MVPDATTRTSFAQRQNGRPTGNGPTLSAVLAYGIPFQTREDPAQEPGRALPRELRHELDELQLPTQRAAASAYNEWLPKPKSAHKRHSGWRENEAASSYDRVVGSSALWQSLNSLSTLAHTFA